jgi:hypothetical protein
MGLDEIKKFRELRRPKLIVRLSKNRFFLD